MATQIVSIIGLAAGAGGKSIKQATLRPFELPVVYFSSWLDAWTPSALFATLLRKRAPNVEGVILFRLSTTELKKIHRVLKLRIHRVHKRSPEIERFYREILACAEEVNRWGGHLAVEIKVAGASRHDEDVRQHIGARYRRGVIRSDRQVCRTRMRKEKRAIRKGEGAQVRTK